jgi:hypothetical protein
MSQSELPSDIARVSSPATSVITDPLLRQHLHDLEIELATSDAQLAAIYETISALEQRAIGLIAADEGGHARDTLVEMNARLRHAALIEEDGAVIRAGIAECHEHLSSPVNPSGGSRG